MKRFALSTLALVVAGVVAWSSGVSIAPAFAQADQNAYFNALIGRADHWKSYSLRKAADITWKSAGGYIACSPTGCSEQLITYSPETDAEPNKQDAAKVRIPPFMAVPGGGGTVTKAMSSDPADPDYNWLYIKQVTSGYIDRQVMVDREIMTIPFYRPGTSLPAYDTPNNRIYVSRGQFQTAVAPHNPGAIAKLSSNSIGQSQLYLPLGTADGHSYLFTWDVYFTDSWLNSGLANMKTFNLASPGFGISQWAQVDTRLSDGPGVCTHSPSFTRGTDVGTVAIRSTNAVVAPNGDWATTDGNRTRDTYGATSNNPLCPIANVFVVKPNRWTRYWILVKQVGNDYDPVDMWVADEQKDPVHVYVNVPQSVRPTGITEFWVEFNTSTNPYVRGSMRDLVSYVRNFAALRDVANPTSVMVRPSATVPVWGNTQPKPPSQPAAPTNLRIMR